MASKGAIFLYNNSENKLSFLSTKGVEEEEPIAPSKALLNSFKKYRHGHALLAGDEKWITGRFKKHSRKLKTKAVLPLYHKENLLGLLCKLGTELLRLFIGKRPNLHTQEIFVTFHKVGIRG